MNNPSIVSPAFRVLALVALVHADALSQFSLTTTFVSNNGQSGNMFDVVALADVSIKGFDVHLEVGLWDVEIYRRNTAGSFVGHEGNPASWTRIARYEDIVSAGAGVPTVLPKDLCERLAPGTTRAFYVTTTTPNTGIRYTNGTVLGAIAASDPRLRILEGSGNVYPFGASFSPRVWNGTIHYGTVIEVPADFATIQAAINAAVNGQVILVSAGNYAQNINFLGKSIKVCSVSGPGATTISGGGAGPTVRFVTGEGLASELRGFTVSAGLGAPGQGGGIHCVDASPTIRDCIITGNTGGGVPGVGSFSGAGGIHGAGFSSFAVLDCTISSNTGGTGSATVVGGAGGVYSRGNPSLERCSIFLNQGGGAAGGTAGAGGVFFGVLAGLTLRDCTVRNNTGGNGRRGGGGGVHAFGDSAGTINDCIIHDNHGGNGTTEIGGGGGLDVDNAHTLVQNTLIYSNTGGNSTSTRGGGGGCSFESDSSARVVNCTVTANTGGVGVGATPGGMLFFQNINGSPDVTNTILWDNSPSEIVVVLVGPNAVPPVITFCDIQGGFAGAGNINSNPFFVNAGAANFHLTAASPCVNAGSAAPSGLPTVDFDGDARNLLGAVDIGADELTIPVLAGSPDDLAIDVQVNGVAGFKVTSGDLLTLRLYSPSGTFIGAPPILVAQLYPNGSPPTGLAALGLPFIHIDLAGLQILFDGTVPTPFGPFGLPPAGVTFAFGISTSLVGNTVRVQGIAVSAAASNGAYAATGAYDIVFN